MEESLSAVIQRAIHGKYSDGNLEGGTGVKWSQFQSLNLPVIFCLPPPPFLLLSGGGTAGNIRWIWNAIGRKSFAWRKVMMFFFGHGPRWSLPIERATSLCWRKSWNSMWRNQNDWKGHGKGELCLSSYQGLGGPLVTSP